MPGCEWRARARWQQERLDAVPRLADREPGCQRTLPRERLVAQRKGLHTNRIRHRPVGRRRRGEREGRKEGRRKKWRKEGEKGREEGRRERKGGRREEEEEEEEEERGMRGKTEREGRTLWCTARPDFLGGLPNALREGLHVVGPGSIGTKWMRSTPAQTFSEYEMWREKRERGARAH